MGAFHGTSSWGDLARNLAWTVPGNMVGGALLVGLVYGWLGKLRPATTAMFAAEQPQPVSVAQLATLTPETANR